MSNEAQAAVDDAHAAIRNALTEIETIPISTLNETEREYVLGALKDLQRADEAIAVRSTICEHPKAVDVLGHDESDQGESAADVAAESDYEATTHSTGGDA